VGRVRGHSASLADEVNIALVGKYVQLPDAYLSVTEALDHAGIHHDHKVNVHWVDAESLTPEEVDQVLSEMDGILVPGGFGDPRHRGQDPGGPLRAREKVPYLGICLGCRWPSPSSRGTSPASTGANSAEFDPVTEHPVIDLMREQHDVADMGGTMRLGSYPCRVVPGNEGLEAYGEEVIYERHRHRFEVNNAYRDRLTEAGWSSAG
jgi:CTP synthase